MGKVVQSLLAASVTAIVLASGPVRAADGDEASVQRRLRAMAAADTDWHPDLAGEFNGLRDYAHGKFKSAMEQFLRAAYYADKLAQLSIGLMYLNGDGVDKDPAVAYAWVDLSAERGYGEYVATRDRIKATLTPEQFERAEALRTQIALTYADDIAKPRLELQLHLGQMQLTGSRLGFNFSVMSWYNVPGAGDEADGMAARMRCAGPSILLGYQSAPITGCGGDALYASTYWQPDKYFASRDALWTRVVVGPLKEQKPNPRPDAQPL